MVVVAVNLDRTPEAAKAMAQKHPEWIVTYSGLGFDDPIVRQLDLYPFPSTWVLTKGGHTFKSDEAMVLTESSGCLTIAQNESRAAFTSAEQWRKICMDVHKADEWYETALVLTANRIANWEHIDTVKWHHTAMFLATNQVAGSEDPEIRKWCEQAVALASNPVVRLEDTNTRKWYEKAASLLTITRWQVKGFNAEEMTERVAREGVRLLDKTAQEKGAALRSKLAKLTPTASGGWSPADVVKSANDDIMAILNAKQGMDEGLNLRQGKLWATKPDVTDLLQIASRTDCLCAPATPAGEAEAKLLTQFFTEVTAPGTSAQVQRLFRLKLLK